MPAPDRTIKSIQGGRSIKLTTLSMTSLLVGLGIALFISLPGKTSANTPPSEFHFQHFGNEEGLSYNEVNCIYQDQRGLLWIGTWDGLCRYDGYEFTCFNQNLFDEGAMPNTEVRAIGSDENGQLLVGFRSGITRFTPGSQFIPLDDGVKFPVRSMARIGKKLMVQAAPNFMHSNKLLRINLEILEAGDEKVSTVKIKSDEMGGILCIQSDKNLLWVGIESGVVLYDPENGKWVEPYPKVTQELRGKAIQAVCRDGIGGIYFGSRANVYYKPPEKDDLLQLPDFHENNSQEYRISCMLPDQHGNLWVGTQKGLFLWTRENRTWRLLVHDPSDPNSLSDNRITCLMEDQSGVLWIGTSNGGLNKLNLFPKPFRNFPSSFFGTGEFIKVYAFEPHTDSTLWIGTTHGLFLFDRVKGIIMDQYEIPAEIEAQTNLGFLIDEWGESRTIMSIHQQEGGKLILGSRWLGLFEFDPSTGQFLSLKAKYPCLNDPSPVRKIHENEKGELWLVSKYIYVLDPQKGTCEIYNESPPNEKLCMAGYYSWNLFQASACDYWIGSRYGWVHWDVCRMRTRLAIERKMIPEAYRLRDAMAVFCIEPAKEGLWMGTYGNGLYFMDTASLRFKHYSVANGLSNNHVYGIQTDEQGRLWMSTNRGISRFTPQTETFDNFGYSDDLLIREFESNSYYTCKDGEIYFGGKNGFACFYPGYFQEKTYAATPAITSFKVFGKELETDSLISDKHHLQLTSSQNFFEIGFSSLDFVNPGNNKYLYKLDPFDPDWIASLGEHRTRYTNLPPGNYTFMLKAANSDGKFNSSVLELQIEIVPQLYQRTWFIVLMVFLGLVLLGGLIFQRLRLVRERDRRRVNRATYELEQETLRARINDHFTFNSLNSIQSFIAKNEKAKAMGYVAKFGRLMRIMLNSSENHFHTLQEEVEALELYFELEQLRCGKAFAYQVRISAAVNPYDLDVPAMLIQPFIENAIWHGLTPLESGGLLDISFEVENGQLLIEVRDNGVGREQARINREQSSYGHTSRGMKLVQRRMDLLNVSLKKGHRFEVVDLMQVEGFVGENGRGGGTLVKVWVPLPE